MVGSSSSSIADSNSFEQWQSEGGLDAAQRANTIWRAMLEGYDAVDPGLDPAVDEALRAFVQTKKDSMPDAFA